MSDKLDYFKAKEMVKALELEDLRVLQRAVDAELEVRGEMMPAQDDGSGVRLGQGVFQIGKHIPAGCYNFRLTQFVSRDAGSSAYIYVFENEDEYRQHLEKNNGRLSTIPSWSVYHNSPVSCLSLKEGMILVIKYNAVIMNKFCIEF